MSEVPALTTIRSLPPMLPAARKPLICSTTVGVAALPAASGLAIMRALTVAKELPPAAAADSDTLNLEAMSWVQMLTLLSFTV
jgi:hypothetical protein